MGGNNLSSLLEVMTPVAVAVAVAAMFMYVKFRTKNARRINLRLTDTSTPKSSLARVPPGSLGWPFIGETLHFISSAYSHSPDFFTLKRRRMYGKVFKSHLFGNRTIVSTDAQVNKIILQNDGRTLIPSYPKSLMELMGKSSVLVVNGGLQRRIHGLIGSFLKSPNLKAQISADMEKYVLEAMGNWTHYSPVFLQDEAKNIAFRVLVKALTSLDGGDQLNLLKKNFQEFIAGLMSLPLNFPGTQLYRSLQAKKKMMKIVDGIIQAKRDSRNSNNPKPKTVIKDVADALVNANGEELTNELISENMIDLMIPGEDSVPILITLAIKFLSDSPTALQQLTEENLGLKMVKEEGGEPLCWNDYLSSLPFTQTVITETLRLGNIIAGVMRKATKDVVIKGQGQGQGQEYLIPKGWSVFAHFRSVHLDDSLHHSPHHFNPWRHWHHHNDRQRKNMNNNLSMTPFGGGQRLCPGLELARLEASVFLHHFVTHFRWEADDDSVINFPTVRMKRRMPIWVTRRY